MNKIIGVLDHKSSNSYSLIRALDKIKVKRLLSKDLEKLKKCYKIIIPGIGNMSIFLKEYKLIDIKNFFKYYLNQGGFV